MSECFRSALGSGIADLQPDGFDNDRRRVAMGIYVVLLEARSADGQSIFSSRAAAVVAARM